MQAARRWRWALALALAQQSLLAQGQRESTHASRGSSSARWAPALPNAPAASLPTCMRPRNTIPSKRLIDLLSRIAALVRPPPTQVVGYSRTGSWWMSSVVRGSGLAAAPHIAGVGSLSHNPRATHGLLSVLMR